MMSRITSLRVLSAGRRGVQYGIRHRVPPPDRRPDGGVQAVTDVVLVHPVHHLEVFLPVGQVEPLLPLTRIARSEGVELPEVVPVGMGAADGVSFTFQFEDLGHLYDRTPTESRFPHAYPNLRIGDRGTGTVDNPDG